MLHAHMHKLTLKLVVSVVSLLVGWITAVYCYRSMVFTTPWGEKEQFFGSGLICGIAFVVLSFVTYKLIIRVVGMLRRNIK